jgi:hypothetical protein
MDEGSSPGADNVLPICRCSLVLTGLRDGPSGAGSHSQCVTAILGKCPEEHRDRDGRRKLTWGNLTTACLKGHTAGAVVLETGFDTGVLRSA